jgi:multiple sugar transport system ATP-binding protein
VVNDLPPKERDIAMVFQNYALYPHMSVGQNIGFALKLQGLRRDEIAKRVGEAARTLQLTELLDRKPGQLSGGQRQRVAMGRAIVRDPAVFLMDEPLSNLDAKLRVQMRAEIAQLQRQLETTTVYVTHDQIEAMTMGDRVAVMLAGELQQVGGPEALYSDPDNLFVAAFIGSPSMNLLEGRLEIDDAGTVLALGSARIALPPNVLRDRPALRAHDRRPIIVGVRPEALSDAWSEPSENLEDACLRATVEMRESLGSELLLHLQTDAAPAVTGATRSAAEVIDTAAVEELERQAEARRATVVARFDPRSRVRTGDSVMVAVDVERLHFFDPDAGTAIRG